MDLSESSDPDSGPPSCIPPPPSPNLAYVSEGEDPRSAMSISPTRSVGTVIVSSDEEHAIDEPPHSSSRKGAHVGLHTGHTEPQAGTSRPATGNSGKASGSGSFWVHQPMMKLGESCEVSEPILPVLPSVKTEASLLPAGLEWLVIDHVDIGLATKIAALLIWNYVRDKEQRFSVRHTPEQVMWALQEGWEGVSIAIMVSKRATVGGGIGGEVVAFISAIPTTLSLYGEVVKAAAVNFFCTKKPLRHLGLAPLLMEELIRQIGSSNIYQGAFTAAASLPFEPFTKATYHHRPLDVSTLINTGFFPLDEYSTVESEEEYYKKGLQGRKQLNFRPIEEADFESAWELVTTYLETFQIHRRFTLGEFMNCFRNRNGVVHTFVTVIDGRVTDFISYYIQTFGVLRSVTNETLKMSMGFINVATSMPKVELFRNALVFSKNNGCHAYTLLDIMNNNDVFEELEFVEGTGKLNYYLYNWRCPSVDPSGVGPAEVIRASQRDNEFISKLKQDIDEMILEVFGQRVWIRCQEYSQYVSGIIYYALTNLMGFQTLGEEYVGVIQVDSSGKSIPSRKALSLMIFTQVLGTPFISFLIKIIENFKKRQCDVASSSIVPKYLHEMFDVFLSTGKLYQRFQPLLNQLHLALFYINGRFFHFSKRLSAIHYILIRHYFGNNDQVTKRNLKYLMWLSIFNLSVCTVHDCYTYLASQKRSSSFELPPSLKISVENDEPYYSPSAPFHADPSKKCSLCLEPRRQSSLTPCGHSFCWSCIIDWLRTEGACPICREAVTPSHIVALQNFI